MVFCQLSIPKNQICNSVFSHWFSNDHNHYNHQAAPFIFTQRTSSFWRHLLSSYLMTVTSKEPTVRHGKCTPGLTVTVHCRVTMIFYTIIPRVVSEKLALEVALRVACIKHILSFHRFKFYLLQHLIGCQNVDTKIAIFAHCAMSLS